MRCSCCGKELKDDAIFCPDCGTKIEVEQKTEVSVQEIPTNENEKKKNTGKSFGKIGGAIAILFIIVCFLTIGGDSEEIQMVKNGSPNGYPNQTYEEAFENFFGSPKWSSFQSEDGEDIVEFTGECMFDKRKVTACMQFTLNKTDGTFEVTYLSFNDVTQNNLMLYGLLAKVFEDGAES